MVPAVGLEPTKQSVLNRCCIPIPACWHNGACGGTRTHTQCVGHGSQPCAYTIPPHMHLNGAHPRIRTETNLVLSQAPLPVGLDEHS